MKSKEDDGALCSERSQVVTVLSGAYMAIL